MNIADEIERLHQLHQSGALSDAEFTQAKARLLVSPTYLGQEVNRFRRSRGDRWLGGICGGLGKFTGLESWVWRLLFTSLILCAGSGVVFYILAWILVPEEDEYLLLKDTPGTKS